MHLLEVPAILSCPGIQSEDRHRVQVVARAHVPAQIRAGVTRGKVQKPELRIDRGRLPDRSTAMRPRIVVLRPGLVPRLARTRDGIEHPLKLTGLRIKGLQATAGPHLSAIEADDHQAVVVQGRRRNGKTVLPTLRCDRPDDFAGALIQGGKPRVGMADEHLAITERHPAARVSEGTTTLRIGIAAVGPQHPPGVHVDGEHVIHGVRHVQHALVGEDLRFACIARLRAGAHASSPQRLESGDIVAVDQGERGIALIRERAAVGNPTVPRRRCELSCVERGSGLDLRSAHRGGHVDARPCGNGKSRAHDREPAQTQATPTTHSTRGR